MYPPVAMSSVDLHDVTAFLAVVESESFTKAAARLGLAKSAVSRRVSALEEALGVRLLHRTTRRLRPTSAGRAYAEKAARAIESITEANETARDMGDAPRGIVRFSAPVDLCESMLPAALGRFVAKYPEIRIDVVATARYVDLVAEGVDFALRFGTLPDSSLVARKLPIGHSCLLASPAYLSQHGTPKRIADLAEHDFVLFRAPTGVMRITLHGPSGAESFEARGRLGGDDLSFVRRAAIDGVGIAFLPTFLVADAVESGALVSVLPRHGASSVAGHIVFPSSRFMPKRVSLLADHLAAEISAAVESADASCRKAARTRGGA